MLKINYKALNAVILTRKHLKPISLHHSGNKYDILTSACFARGTMRQLDDFCFLLSVAEKV